jgi:Na+/melibiose symporter-like transporter
VTYYYSNKDGGLTLFYTALLGGSFMLGQFAISPFVPRMLTRISKKNLFIWSNILAAVPCVLMFLLYLSGPDKMASASYLAFSVINFIINGVAGGISSMLFTFMTIDAVDYEEHRNNIRPDGVFFAGSTFLGKAGAGVASIIYGVACRYAGFSGENIRLLDVAMHEGLVVRTAMMMDPQIKGYITMMFFVVTIPVAISAVLCVIPLLKYELSDKEHKRILSELNQKRHGEAATEIATPAP